MKVAALEKEELESSDLGRDKGWWVSRGSWAGFYSSSQEEGRGWQGDSRDPQALVSNATSFSWVTPTRIQMCSGMFQLETTTILKPIFLLTCMPVAVRFPTVDCPHCPCCALPSLQPSVSVPLYWSRGGDTAHVTHHISGHATSLSYSASLTV